MYREGNGIQVSKPYEYKGKNILSFIKKSPNGSISYDILTSMLRHLDNNFRFNRTDPNRLPGPVILLDVPDSRLQLPLLHYVNSPDTKWMSGIGVPYGTSLCRVGDSEEINGNMNIASY